MTSIKRCTFDKVNFPPTTRTFGLSTRSLRCNKLHVPTGKNKAPAPSRALWSLARWNFSVWWIWHESLCFPGNSAGDLFGMVKTWPFGKVKWPPNRGSKGHGFPWSTSQAPLATCNSRRHVATIHLRSDRSGKTADDLGSQESSGIPGKIPKSRKKIPKIVSPPFDPIKSF